MSAKGPVAVCCQAVASRRAFSTAARRAASDKSRYILQKDDATFPKGFQAAACHSGIKKAKGALDLAIVTSTSSEPASAAACFTKNVFQAAPVQVSRDILLRNKGKARSVVINSGCANAVTGKQGLQNAWTMSRCTDEVCGHKDGSLVLSTGVIGQHVPIDKIENALPGIASKLGDGFDAWTDVSRAFMTTDTFPKLRTRRFKLGPTEVRLAGIDKGAGMIYPRMGPPGPPHATLLGLIATDAKIAPEALQRALTYAIDRSFNSISVDGDMSTNDTVIALANGASGASDISSHKSAEFEQFQDELTSFATELASLVVRDGEGATKFVSITVNGSPSYEDAHHIASVVARSPLVKTAIHGADANWGRILCAVGYSTPSSFTVDPSKVSVSFVPVGGGNPLRTLVNGEPEAVDEVLAKQMLSQEDVSIVIDLQAGSQSATYYTCDFSKEYITINGDYRS